MTNQPSEKKNSPALSEDWLSILLAFLFLLLSVLGVLGETGIQIKF